MSQQIEKIEQVNQAKGMIGYFKDKKNRLFATIFTLVFGIVFTAFLTEHRIGINYFIVVTMLTFIFGYVMYKDDNLSIGRYIFWAAILLIYSSVFFRLKNDIYTIITILFLPLLIVIATIFSAKKMPSNVFVNGVIRFFGSIAFVDKIFIAIKSLIDKNGDKSKKQTVKILIGVGISLVLLLMIVPLMFSADAVFESFMIDLVDFTKITKLLWKSVLSAVIAILFFGFLYIITVKKDTPKATGNFKNKVYDANTVLLIVLGVVGVIYTLFASVQFTYLFGGLKSGLPEGVSITNYARSGYFEQVFMSMINLIIIGVSIFLTDKSSGKSKSVVNIMLAYFIAINFYLLTSAAKKMGLYQNAYGFTVLRLLVDVLIIFEALVFILLLVKIFARKTKLIKNIVYFTAAFWAIVSLVNIEGFSADLNIARYEKKGEIDIAHMCRLNDVSSQLKYLYTHEYESFDENEIERIEAYFFKDYRNSYKYDNDEIKSLYKPVEFNISAAKRLSDANEVLEQNISR